MSKFYVSFDRLAGPRSRYFNMSKPFNTFQEAEAHIAAIVDETETEKDKLRILHEAVIITDKDLRDMEPVND